MEEITTLSRKERERLNRKKEIMDAAAKLFSEKGFSHTTLEEIAAKAEFGTGTIYNYFQSKEDILKSILDFLFDESNELVEICAQKTGDFISFFKMYVQEMMEYSLRNKKAIIILVSVFTSKSEKPISFNEDCFEEKSKKRRNVFVEKFRDGIKNKEIADIDAEQFSFFFDHLLFPYVTHLIKENNLNESNINSHVDFITNIIFNGILVR
jgi:AcrR family transcriptional regulator